MGQLYHARVVDGSNRSACETTASLTIVPVPQPLNYGEIYLLGNNGAGIQSHVQDHGVAHIHDRKTLFLVVNRQIMAACHVGARPDKAAAYRSNPELIQTSARITPSRL